MGRNAGSVSSIDQWRRSLPMGSAASRPRSKRRPSVIHLLKPAPPGIDCRPPSAIDGSARPPSAWRGGGPVFDESLAGKGLSRVAEPKLRPRYGEAVVVGAGEAVGWPRIGLAR